METGERDREWEREKDRDRECERGKMLDVIINARRDNEC